MDYGLWFVSIFALFGGLFAARLGVGVGAMLAPILIMTPGVTTREAIGAALLAEVFVQAASLSADNRSEAIDQATVRKLAPLAIAAGVIGSAATGAVNDSLLKLLVGLAVVAVGVSYIFELDAEEEDARIALGRDLEEPIEPREVTAFGETFAYSTTRMDEAQAVAAGGGIATGLLGCGQIALNRQSLLKRQRIPSVVATVTTLMLGLMTAFAAGVTQLLFAVIGESGLGHITSLLVFLIAGGSIGALAVPRLPPFRWEWLLQAVGGFLLLLGCLTITNGLFR